MRHPRPGVGSELLPVALILIGLVGTFGLVVSMHRKAIATRAVADRTPAPSAPVVVPTPAPPSPAEPDEAPPPPTPPVAVQPPPPPLAEDPTEKALAALGSQEAEQRRAAVEADRRTAALEKARLAAVAGARKWKRREALVRAQADDLTEKARNLEMEADSLAMERDVLAQECDAAKAALAKARARNGGYAVMPNKSANGTWQRPVMIECRNGQAVLQPKGLSFSMMELSGVLTPRSSPFVLAVGRELIRAGRATSPDGSGVVPYIYFVIRPDGIRPYYEARSRLEPLGIAFGYELVEQDWEIEFPDFDDLDAWDGSAPARPKDANPSAAPGPAFANRGSDSGRGTVSGGFGSSGNGPERVANRSSFVWPSGRGGGTGDRNGSGDGPATVADRGGETTPGNKPVDGPKGLDGDANGFVWPAERPGGLAKGNGLWPTQPTGQTLGGPTPADGLASADGQGQVPRGTGSGPRRFVPPLETGNPGVLVAPKAGDPGEGSGTGTRGRSSPGATDPGPGLVPVSPEGLPGLDSPEQSLEGNHGPPARPGSSTRGRPGQARPVPRFDPEQLTRSPAELNDLVSRLPGIAAGDTTGAGGRFSKALNATPPPGWVRIDPALLARAVDGDPDDPEKPSALPANAKQGDATGRSSGGSNGQGTGSSSGPDGPKPPLGSAGPGIPSLSAGQSGQKGDYRPKASTTRPWAPRMNTAIDVPLDLVVACSADGVVIHPGGYRLSRAALGKDGALKRDLETIVRNHEMIDAGVRPRPRVQFLIGRGGLETYAVARKKTVLAGLPWPVTTDVVGSQTAASVFPKERF